MRAFLVRAVWWTVLSKRVNLDTGFYHKLAMRCGQSNEPEDTLFDVACHGLIRPSKRTMPARSTPTPAPRGLLQRW
jgi:hypothetical protein